MSSMNKVGTWSAAFTITVSGLQIDFTELSQQNQIEILRELIQGSTCGEIMEKEKVGYIQAVS